MEACSNKASNLVVRVSLGSAPMRATMALMRDMADEFRGAGTYTRMLGNTISYAEANQLMG